MSRLLIGCWSREKAIKGLNVCSFNDNTGEIRILNKYLEAINIACDPLVENNLIYFAEDMSAIRNDKIIANDYIYQGKISDNKIKDISCNSSLAVNLTYCSIDVSGKYLLASHHSSSKHKVSRLYKENGKVINKILNDVAPLVLFEIINNQIVPVDFFVNDNTNTKSSILHSLYRIKEQNLYFACDKGLDQCH